MKIYLVNPPASKGIPMVREGRCMQRRGAWTTLWPPITMATMAALLQRHGHTVALSDCIAENLDTRRLAQRIGAFEPDLVVINTATASIYADLQTSALSKDTWAAARTAVFGIHVTVLPEEAFGFTPQLDFVIRGEPEFCLSELAGALAAGTADLGGITGLSWRSKEKILHNPNRGFSQSLEDLPPPAWELIDISNYRVPLSGEPFLLVTTSKGCPHECLFCPAKPYYGSRLRLRPVSAVVDEIAYVQKRFAVNSFLIWSESFTEERAFVVAFCQALIERRIKISWVCNSRVDRVDRELLLLMKKAGCWMIGYGIESWDQGVLDRNKKGVTLGQIQEAIAAAQEAGLLITAHVIFGLPGETKASARQTIKRLRASPVDFAQIYCAVPWPSTGLYHLARTNGWLATDNWERFEQNYSVMRTETLTCRQIEALRRSAMRAFYLSGRRIAGVLSRIDSPRKLGLFLRALREFLGWL